VDFQFVRGNAGASVAYEPNLQLFAASSDHDGFVIYLRPSSPVNVIDQEEDPLALAIYPNPCKAGDCQLTVNAAVQIDALEVKDIMGRTRFVIQPEFLSASSLMLIELPLPAGLYTIKMKSREKIYIRSLIIQ